MKMSDVFNLPLVVCVANPQMLTAKQTINGKVDYHSATIRSPNHDEITCAAHAINNHDRLTSENARLQSKLTTITKQRDELLKCLETVSSHAVYRAGTFNGYSK